MKPAQLTYDEIEVGQVYTFKTTITKDDVLQFAKLSGDNNPLHTNEAFARATKFKQNTVHGMLAGSLFSTLVGMHCPGERCLYLSQTLQFKAPIHYDDTVIVKGTVTHKVDSCKMVTLKTEILKDDKVLIVGEAKTQVM